MTSGHHVDMWLPVLVVMLPVVAVTIRCAVLLAGLIVTLTKAAKADRPHIFREFARAVAAPYLPREKNEYGDSPVVECTDHRQLARNTQRSRPRSRNLLSRHITYLVFIPAIIEALPRNLVISHYQI
jgi:hypothetical protein